MMKANDHDSHATSRARISGMHHAHVRRNDEFYTQLPDIENELKHYNAHFRDKVILCNCDDPRASWFHYYFRQRFTLLGLKKLITTCYRNQNPDLFSSHDCEKAVYLEYNGCKTGRPRHLKKDGDFRNEESIALLQQADIVVTNPPFSLFREYVAQLTQYNKKFLIIGNANAITYKEIFPLIKENKIWLGNKKTSGGMLFGVPQEYADELVATKKESAYKIVDGVAQAIIPAIWFTNLPHAKRNEVLDLYKSYDPAEYQKYDNYDAINVNYVNDIPKDYGEVMGVPITFLDKYNPDQFEILGLSAKSGFGLTSHKFYDDFVEVRQNGSLTGSSGKKTNGNPVMQGKSPKGNYFKKGDVFVHSLYGRIFIKHKRI